MNRPSRKTVVRIIAVIALTIGWVVWRQGETRKRAGSPRNQHHPLPLR